MGRVRTETVKRVARELLEKYPARFSGDFEANKVSVNELVFTKSKRLRNRIAGYVTRLTVIQSDRAASMASAAGESEGDGSVGEEEE